MEDTPPHRPSKSQVAAGRVSAFDDEPSLQIENGRFLMPETDPSVADLKARADRVRLVEAETRSIVFLGRSRAGKTTAMYVLSDPFVTVTTQSIFSQTRKASIRHFTVKNASPQQQQQHPHQKRYIMNLIDTPGLFERSQNPQQARTNAVILSTIATCLDSHIRHIHALFFVCSFQSGLNHEDVQGIKDLADMFRQTTTSTTSAPTPVREPHAQQPGIMHLLVTRCEGKSPDALARLENEIRQIAELQDFFHTTGARVFFTGALGADEIADPQGREPDESSSAFTFGLESSKQTYSSVIEMRQRLYSFLFEELSGEGTPISTLACFSAHTRLMNVLGDKVSERTEQVDRWLDANDITGCVTATNNAVNRKHRFELGDLEHKLYKLISEFGSFRAELPIRQQEALQRIMARAQAVVDRAHKRAAQKQELKRQHALELERQQEECESTAFWVQTQQEQLQQDMDWMDGEASLLTNQLCEELAVASSSKTHLEAEVLRLEREAEAAQLCQQQQEEASIEEVLVLRAELEREKAKRQEADNDLLAMRTHCRELEALGKEKDAVLDALLYK
eukprot:TRINITY_DN1267_c0_g1_i2.p1 TRINITY_DN1267_c0_g1~~TRINITY_DN1267_c0_g1_i2.p1  ORF type:complete len:566 (+),score=119.61 TRINITY_DN1267_c0_g1_i2:144-1841(+)